MLIEVRDYHYRPDRMAEYRVWAEEAGRFLRARWDVSGFWLDSGEPGQMMGSDPVESPHGPANVTWVIRWSDMETRQSEWDSLWEDAEWKALWDRHPGFDGYLQLSVRFLEEA